MSGNLEAFQQAIDLGHSAAWEKSWSKAAAFYRSALQEFPDHPAALNSLALALYQMEDYEAAARFYLRASQVSPSDPAAFEKLAIIYEQLDRLKDAARASSQAAELYLKMQDEDKAVLNLRRVLSLQESLPARTRLGMIFERSGRKPEAVSEYLACAALLQQSGEREKALKVVEYALKLIPEHAKASRALALLRANQPLTQPLRPSRMPKQKGPGTQVNTAEPAQVRTLDPISEARAAALSQMAGLLFERANGSEFETPSMRRGISSLTKGTGGLSAARAERRRILMFVGQAVDSLTQGQDARAGEELERAVEIGLRHPAAFLLLGTITQVKDPQKALRFLEQCAGHHEYALAAQLISAKIQQAENNLPQACRAFLKALALADAATVAPEHADQLLQLYDPLAEQVLQRSDEQGLRKICQTLSLQLNRANWQAHLRAARQQLPVRDADDLPRPLVEIILETSTGAVVERLALVRSLADQNKNTAAMDVAFHALHYAPTYLPLHIQIGELLVREGRIRDAVSKHMLVAELYHLRGDTQQAVALLKNVVQYAPMDAAVRTRLIDLLQAQGQYDEAVQQYLQLADLHTRLSDLNAAHQAYLKALELARLNCLDHPILVDILMRIADIDSQHLEFRSAITNLQQVRDLDPQNSAVRAQLVELNFRTGKDSEALNEVNQYMSVLEKTSSPQKAIDFLEEAVNERPEKLELRRMLAGTYQRCGQVEQAVDQLEALAQGLLASGKRKEAVAVLESILILKPANVEKYQKILQKLQANPGR